MHQLLDLALTLGVLNKVKNDLLKGLIDIYNFGEIPIQLEADQARQFLKRECIRDRIAKLPHLIAAENHDAPPAGVAAVCAFSLRKSCPISRANSRSRVSPGGGSVAKMEET